jgi:hypothetical protein
MQILVQHRHNADLEILAEEVELSEMPVRHAQVLPDGNIERRVKKGSWIAKMNRWMSGEGVTLPDGVEGVFEPSTSSDLNQDKTPGTVSFPARSTKALADHYSGLRIAPTE